MTQPDDATTEHTPGADDCLRSSPVFHDDPVEQLAFEIAWELEEADLNPGDLVKVNHAKLLAIAERVLGRLEQVRATGAK